MAREAVEAWAAGVSGEAGAVEAVEFAGAAGARCPHLECHMGQRGRSRAWTVRSKDCGE